MAPTPPPDVSDGLARLLARLDLTEAALAQRAGMTRAYLRTLLDADRDFDPAGLARLTTAIDTADRDLADARTARPPGQAPPNDSPALIRLTTSECWARLAPGGIGRIAVPSTPGPAVLPVNYTVDTGAILYRTDPHSAAAPAPGTTVSFQADHIDDRTSTGWSVLATGTVEHLGPDQVERLSPRTDVRPWAGGERPLWIRLRPDALAGRRIGVIDTGHHLH